LPTFSLCPRLQPSIASRTTAATVTNSRYWYTRMMAPHRPSSNRNEASSTWPFFYMDTAAGITLVNTVEKNKSKYTNCDYSRAVLARNSKRSLAAQVPETQLPNCPVERDDILAAEDIFGPDLGSLKGKTVRRGGEHVRPAHADIPATIMSRYRNVTVSVTSCSSTRFPFLCQSLGTLNLGRTK
jgi:hypothetical protein